jgi:hypothetical protein
MRGVDAGFRFEEGEGDIVSALGQMAPDFGGADGAYANDGDKKKAKDYKDTGCANRLLTHK